MCACAACNGAWSPGCQGAMGGERWEWHCSHGAHSDLRWYHPHAHRPLQLQGTLPARIQTSHLLGPPDQTAVSLLLIFDRDSSLILWQWNLPGYKPARYSDPLTKLLWVSSLTEVIACDSLTANLPGYKPAPYSDKLLWGSSLIQIVVCDSLTAKKPACDWLL